MGDALLLVGHHLLEELGQAGNQLIAAADYMQAALVLMLFQDFVQSAFQFIHGYTHMLFEVTAQLVQ
jgi:hypothetical protein